MTFEDAILHALHKCEHDGVKPTASNVACRLQDTFLFYSQETIKVKLSDMHRRGILIKPSPRGGYIPITRIEFCDKCGQVLPQQLKFSFAS